MRYSLKLTKDLKRNPYSGLYIAIEGIDGSGKSTQLEAVQKSLEELGQEVITTSEPQPTGAIQKLIRDALFSKVKIPSRGYQNLYSADRALNHEEIIAPALKSGKTVLSHRSLWSNEPYGILDFGEDYNFSQTGPLLVSQGTISEYYQFMVPDLTFYLRVSAKKAAGRLAQMDKVKDTYEKEEKLAKIVKGYDMLVDNFPEELVVINGEQDEKVITQEILQKISKHKK
ncbi:MAG: dTMP kinase [Candidatus Levybacteria bacterium]|nr:dTMP kinase [Candidatus Levybacteria bacterium]